MPSTVHRRKAQLCLEALERREVLSSFTWNGSAGDGIWDNGGNWVGGNAPTTGHVDIVLQSLASPQTLTLGAADTGLVFDSFTVQGGSYTLQAPSQNDFQLVFADGASLATDNGSSLTTTPSLKLLGSTTKTGTGTLVIDSGTALYAAPAPTLQPFHISGGSVTMGRSVTLDQSLMQLDAGTRLVVSENVIALVGSLTGSGTVQVGVNAGMTSTTIFEIDPPQGESDVFSGVIEGQGGQLFKLGDGSSTLGSVNANQSGLFKVGVLSGSLLVNGVLNAQSLQVQPGATFGGLATMNFSGTVTFESGATFAATINGTAPGQFTHLNDTDTTDPNPVNLGGSTLSLSLGYVPANGDSNTIVSAAHGITGQFANASNGQTITVNGVPYFVNASAPSVTLTVSSSPATMLVVTSPPPGTITAGTPFGLTVQAVDNSGHVDLSYSGVVTVTANPGGNTFTTTASHGVATFSGLILNTPGAYTLQVTASGLTATTTNPFNVTPVVSIPTPPVVLGQRVLLKQKLNKKGKKVGKPVFQGFVLNYSTAMASSASRHANYRVESAIIKRVKGKQVVVYKAVNFQVAYNAATHSVSVLVTGQQFLKGGRITVIASAPNGVSDTSGVFLDGNGDGLAGGNAIFKISAKAKSITRA
jgi:hypothetical protein